MAKAAKKTKIEEKTKSLSSILPSSYTKETAGNLLKAYGLHFRHKDIVNELFTKKSVYKQMLRLPALVIYNQSIINRIIASKNYLQEKITNIIFAVTAVRANNPHIEKPLSQKRQEDYSFIQNLNNQTSEEAIDLAIEHDKVRDEIFDKLYDQIHDWRDSCRETAAAITNNLNENGFNLNETFVDILQKHLERPGMNQLSVNELNEMNIKEPLNHAEIALVCALREVEKHGSD